MENPITVTFKLNGKTTALAVEPLTTLRTRAARASAPARHQGRLRAGRLRQLHRAGQRRANAVVPAAAGAGRWADV